MQSILDPNVLYTDLSRDIVEHDVDVVSDLWNMDERDVYRGSRDIQYTHANVYWLYDEDLTRVGLVEHSLSNHADFRILWFHDNPFATLLQEEWTSEQSLWSVLPLATTERFFAEGWVTPETVLEPCLHGDCRIVTVETLLNPPNVHACTKCGIKSLKTFTCEDTVFRISFPDKEKIVFIDDDLYVCEPPAGSRVWELLGFRSPHPPADDEPALQAQVQELVQEAPMDSPAQTPAPPESAPQPEEPVPPEEHPQAHPLPQTARQPTPETEQTPERTRFATSLRSPGPKRRYSG
jgi:hypothetical protein